MDSDDLRVFSAYPSSDDVDLRGRGGADLDLRVFSAYPSSDDVDLRGRGGADLDTVSGLEGVLQSIRLHVLSPRGGSAELGWPAHGSMLPNLMGRPDTALNRTAAAAALREALATHPQVQEVGRVRVFPDRRRGLLELTAEVTLQDGTQLLFGTIQIPVGG